MLQPQDASAQAENNTGPQRAVGRRAHCTRRKDEGWWLWAGDERPGSPCVGQVMPGHSGICPCGEKGTEGEEKDIEQED